MTHLKAFLLALTLLGLSLAQSSAQEAVRVRAGVQPNLGRIVFDWPGPIAYDAKIEGRLATISFERPGNFDLGPLRTTLSGFVSDAAIGDGGRTIRLTLTADYQLRKMLNGSSVIIDFVGTPGRAPLPPPPPPAPVQAAAPPPPPRPKPAPAPTPLKPAISSAPVKLQAGQQEAFTRLSFIWPGPPPAYTATKSGPVVNLTFARGSKVEMGNIEAEPPRFVKAVRLLSTQDHLAFNIEMEPGSSFRHFSEERDVVIDVMAPGMSNPAPTESATKQIAEDQRALAERQGEITGPKSQVFDPDNGPLPERLTTPELARAQRADAEKRAQAELDRLNASAKKSEPAAAAQPAAPAQTAASEPPPEPAKPMPALRAGPVISMPVPPTPAGSVGTVTVTYASEGARTRLGFPFPVHTPAAVFTRAGAVWAIFDAQATLDFKALSSSALKPRQLPTQRGTVFLMPLPEGQGVEVGADDNLWTIDLAASPDRGEPAEVIPRPNKPGGADVLIQLRERGDFHHLDDPIVGDHLDIATTLRPGQGVAATYAFQAFELLPTAQGVVVEPEMDGITIEADPEGVAITQEGGLALSNGVRPSEQAMRGAGGTPGAEGFVEFDKWGRQNEGSFWRVREKLERAAALAPRLVKNAARLELTRFFLANHFNAEALGELNLMASTEPDLDRDVGFHALRGIARVGMYRAKEGIEDLSIPQLQVDANAALWRGLADTYLQDWSAAAAEFRRGLKLIDRYPAREHLMFALASARANIELGDKEAAATDVTDINKLKPGPPQSFRAQYLLGRLKELRNDTGGALSDYDKVIAGNDRESRANARYRKILLQEHAGTITAAEAIDQLETLRYTWRGDDLERDILRSLGQIYVKSGDYRTAFETMRSAIAKYPSTKQADAIKDDMNRVFADLFLRGGANALPPVKALGLYYDYRDLTPVGKDGDEMIRRLADRLVSVDLLSQAEELLQHQVEKRLAGTAQAQVAARLAVIYLLDKKPGDAAKILDQTRQIQLPTQLTHQRALLYARAEMDLSRTSDALAAIQGDDSLDAQRLRADIYWAAADWGNAAKSMDVLLAPAASNSNPLDPAQINLVLKSTIALALAGDKNGLDRMKRTFGPRMEKTADNESFQALTTSPDLNNVGFRDLASRIANTKTFESFLSGYEQQIRAGGLGAIN